LSSRLVARAATATPRGRAAPRLTDPVTIMEKDRLQAFSDGVIAIIIPIMVLEPKVPHGKNFAALAAQWPKLLAYALSFANIGLIWNNHHHLLLAVEKVDGRVLWANLFLIFWLSLLPFVTARMGESHYADFPTALYGIDMLLLAGAWYLLVRSLIAVNGRESLLARAVGRDRKTIASAVLNVIAIPSALLGAGAPAPGTGAGGRP
jgi:TMEM175 potassium channel family protein